MSICSMSLCSLAMRWGFKIPNTIAPNVWMRCTAIRRPNARRSTAIGQAARGPKPKQFSMLPYCSGGNTAYPCPPIKRSHVSSATADQHRGKRGSAMQSNIHIHAEYRITLSDYRKAVYCALVIRRHRLFLCMLLILAAAFIYAVGRFSGLFPVCYPLVFVAAAELIWGLVLFAGAEKSVRAYMRTPNNYLGAAFAADFEDLRLHIQSPEHGVNLSIPWTKVYCVLEYSSFFSVYLTPQETCIIPRRALSADDDAALRALFSDRLGKRYTPARLHTR